MLRPSAMPRRFTGNALVSMRSDASLQRSPGDRFRVHNVKHFCLRQGGRVSPFQNMCIQQRLDLFLYFPSRGIQDDVVPVNQ